jgi:hypothetical protein
MYFDLEQEIFELEMRKNLKKDIFLQYQSFITILEIKEIINRIKFLKHQIQQNRII